METVELGEKIDLEAADTILVPCRALSVISSTVKPVKTTYMNRQLGCSQ
jgi:hypothetical protein